MINVRNLQFSYPKSDIEAIKNLNFSITKGEIFGFLGPRGAGKTTTQRLIIGLLRGYNGSIEIMGKERSQWDYNFYENIGVAFDFPNLYLKLTGEENLNLIGSYYRSFPKDIDGLLTRVGLQGERKKKVEDYSKGMKMRLNFIRAIMHDPEILFFDEPTSGLDPMNARIIKDMILELKKRGKTIFLTTHHMDVAEQLCDRVAFINEGTITAVDRPKSLMVQYGKPMVRIEYEKQGALLSEKLPLDTLKDNPVFMDILKHHQILTIHSQEATLEEVFILLNGRALL
ncbi:MAG TPA: ABC transporter ATP-binding protein [Proteiniclasticum sp.]|nr:ABC transporter ATP-binding protein [Proteiniclasticum sp.]